jgi:hypothetical protein
VADVGLAVARRDDARRALARGVEVAVVADDLAGLCEQRLALRVERGARFARERAARPLDLERISAP